MADKRWLYVDPSVAAQKGTPLEALRRTFPPTYQFFTNTSELRVALRNLRSTRPLVLALLSSGTLGGLTRDEFY